MKFISHMCPWLPESFFEALVAAWAQELDEPGRLLVDLNSSGPSKCQLQSDAHPLLNLEAEVGMVCAPSFFWAQRPQEPKLELAGWTSVFDDVHQPVYHSVVLVPADSPARNLEDLRRAHWLFNDPCSLSGYFSVLASLGCSAEDFEGRATFSGGHKRSLEKLLAGVGEACAVDSNGWSIQRTLREKTLGRLREVARLGPFPSQPLVLSAKLPERRKEALRKSLSAAVQRESLLQDLRRRFGLCRFVPTDLSHYARLDLSLQKEEP